MLTIKTSDQLRTRRNVKSYRAGPTSTGMPMRPTELGRLEQEEVALANRKLHRLRRRHEEAAARGSRELRRHRLAALRWPRGDWR